MISIHEVLILSAILFGIGVLGVLIRKNAIIIFMSIELMLNAVNLAFVAFSIQFQSLDGILFSFFVVMVAAAEAVIGLAILLSIYRKKNTVNIDSFNLLKG